MTKVTSSYERDLDKYRKGCFFMAEVGIYSCIPLPLGRRIRCLKTPPLPPSLFRTLRLHGPISTVWLAVDRKFWTIREIALHAIRQPAQQPSYLQPHVVLGAVIVSNIFKLTANCPEHPLKFVSRYSTNKIIEDDPRSGILLISMDLSGIVAILQRKKRRKRWKLSPCELLCSSRSRLAGHTRLET